MTASAWTPTPKPTLTPTPLPYELEVTLVGEDGESITMASVTVGEMDPVKVQATGKAQLLNLSGPEVNLEMTAQGYEPLEETVTLENGPNQVSYSLVLDPMQVNPVTACLPGQEVLLIEDFEDTKLQNWRGSVSKPMWNFIDVVDRGMTLQADTTVGEEYYIGYPESFGNSVWHFEILRESGINLIWVRSHAQEGKSYITLFEGDNRISIQREDAPDPVGNLGGRAITKEGSQTWEKFSLVFFDGTFEIWYNDEIFYGILDVEPLGEGGISIIIAPSKAKIAFDNFVVCGLSELYTPPVEDEVVEGE